MKCERGRKDGGVVRVDVRLGKCLEGEKGVEARCRRHCWVFLLFCYLKFLSFHGLLT